MADGEYIGFGEVVAMSPFPEGTWRHWRLHKTGPTAVKIGRRLVYRRSEVTAWIEAQFEKAASA